MYGKFIGLDIGSSSTKITLIKRGLRGTEILETVQLKSLESGIAQTNTVANSSEAGVGGKGRGFDAVEGVVTDTRPAQKAAGSSKLVSATLGELFTESGFPRSDIATSPLDIPISIRVLKFPFYDPNKIDQVYSFELESISPFDPQDKVHGYHLVRSAEGGEALVCMFEKGHIKHLLDICERWEIDPRVVTFAPLASNALNGFFPQERPLVLINIGASKMTFSLLDEEGIRRVRASAKAGNLITELLSQNLRVPFEEAEYVKLNRLKDVEAAALESAVSPVFDEIKKTVHFFEMDTKRSVETVLISGGTSLMPGIEDYLGTEINKNVRKLFIPDLGEDKSPVFSDSFALALYGSAFRKGNLNLRKGEFKYVGGNEELRSTFRIPAVLLALLILLFFYRTGERYFELKNRVENLEAQIEREVRETFPSIKVIPKPVIFLENEVKGVRDKLALFQGIRGGTTPLEVLRNISVGIPQDTNVVVEEVSFMDDKTVRVVGKSNSYEQVSEIEKALSDIQMFNRVSIDSTNTALNNSIKFQMTLVLKQ